MTIRRSGGTVTDGRDGAIPAAEASSWRVGRNVTEQLNRFAAALAAEGERRLPPEDQLSSRLGVSRATIRSALQSLEKEGKIARRHGSGTFINSHTLGLKANLTEDRSFVELLGNLGYTPTIRPLRIYPTGLPEDIASRLTVPAGEDAYVVERVYEASGEPAIMAIDYVPQRLFLSDAPAELRSEQSTFAFLRRYTGRDTRYSVAGIVPVLPDEVVCAALNVPPSQPLLLLDHTHIDTDDEPIGVTRAYVNDRYLRFSVTRTLQHH